MKTAYMDEELAAMPARPILINPALRTYETSPIKSFAAGWYCGKLGKHHVILQSDSTFCGEDFGSCQKICDVHNRRLGLSNKEVAVIGKHVPNIIHVSQAAMTHVSKKSVN